MNTSYLFYKGYFSNWKNENWRDLESKEGLKSKKNEALLKEHNEKIFKSKLFIDYSAAALNEGFIKVPLQTSYPGLFIGSGYAHGTNALGEIKLGFHLDYTTGMPIIPGSSIKGVIRSVFPQFKKNATMPWLPNLNPEGSTSEARLKSIHNLNIKCTRALMLAYHLELLDEASFSGYYNIDDDTPRINESSKAIYNLIHKIELTLFEGLNTTESESSNKSVYYPMYERDIFCDAIPSITHGKSLFSSDFITPHIDTKGKSPYAEAMLKNPTPLQFMKVSPEVQFDFHFITNTPENEEFPSQISKEKRHTFYQDVLETIGIGAKSNLGYGKLIEPFKGYKKGDSFEVEVISTDFKNYILSISFKDKEYKINNIGKKIVNYHKGQKIRVEVNIVDSGGDIKFRLA